MINDCGDVMTLTTLCGTRFFFVDLRGKKRSFLITTENHRVGTGKHGGGMLTTEKTCEDLLYLRHRRSIKANSPNQPDDGLTNG